MSRASLHTSLPLSQWASILGIDPWQFSQVGKGLPKEITAQCASVWFQFPYQQDFLCREEAAQAIQSAEDLIAELISFYPGPRYFEGEEVKFSPPRVGGKGSRLNIFGTEKPINLKWHKLIGTGTLIRTAVDLAAVPVFSARAGTFENKFTITVTVPAGTAEEDVAVYFTETDRLGEPIEEIWRIRPVRVVITGTTAVITGHKALLVLPTLQEDYAASILNAADAIFATTLSVYITSLDETFTTANPAQGIAVWDPIPGCEPDCSVLTAPICLTPRSAESGVVNLKMTPADMPYQYAPDRLYVNYMAGEPYTTGKMQAQWARAVTYLSTTFLASEKCGCERSNKILRFWRMLPSSSGATTDARPITPTEVDENPLGSPRRGARYAWNTIKQMVGDSFGYG